MKISIIDNAIVILNKDREQLVYLNRHLAFGKLLAFNYVRRIAMQFVRSLYFCTLQKG